jgi:RNA polymerase sigma-70 factor (ECF subfamily)
MKQLSDEILVHEVQEGNIPAFETLVNRYQRKLVSFVTSIIRDPDASQDIVQETFIQLYKTIERVDTTKKFSSYLYAITRNQAISYIRSKKPQVALSEARDIATTDTPDTRLERIDQATSVEEALKLIDNRYRKVITLYYYDNLSYEQISKLLHLPVNTIRTHLRRAKSALKQFFLT